jgi:hypothetical protein
MRSVYEVEFLYICIYLHITRGLKIVQLNLNCINLPIIFFHFVKQIWRSNWKKDMVVLPWQPLIWKYFVLKQVKIKLPKLIFKENLFYNSWSFSLIVSRKCMVILKKSLLETMYGCLVWKCEGCCLHVFLVIRNENLC